MQDKQREQTKIVKSIIKIGNNISSFSTYSCQPKNKYELKNIIKERIYKEGFNCNLNDIDVSLIDDMSYLFVDSKFNGDISKWDVSRVKTMYGMFYSSSFNGDISNWNITNLKDISGMFYKSKFNQPLYRWNVSNVKIMYCTFAYSEFNQDISNWKINSKCNTKNVFNEAKIKEEIKPKTLISQ